MKKYIRILAVIGACVSLANLTACGGGGNEGGSTEKVDTTKAQLYLSNFDGGVGTKWLEEAADRFEEKYKDTPFVEGTQGVQIWIERQKGVTVEKFPNERNDIYFLENTNYYNMISTGNLLDITDMVTEPMTEFGETVSVEDKLYDNYKSYFKTSAGKYFAIPHYKGIYGITYDRALWNEKGLFLSSNGKVEKKETDTGLSNGPDGKAGTYDDGLPATYDEFYKVCDAMVKRSITPITWAGQYQWYFTGFMGALKADFEGEHADIAYTYNGETYDKLVKSINADGSVVYDEPMAISEENGYEMFRSAGNYYPLQFLETLIKKNYYATQSFNDSVSHLDTQGTYLLSKYVGKRIGMLVEGCWWANEANSYVKQMETRYGDSLNDRRFAIMPYPKATTAEVGEPQTVLDTAKSLACINANIDKNKIDLAKLFLQFLQTEDELVKFLQSTSMTRNYKYEVSDEVYNGLNTFAKSVSDVLVNCEHVMPAGSSEFSYRNAFAYNGWFDTSKYGICTKAIKNLSICNHLSLLW